MGDDKSFSDDVKSFAADSKDIAIRIAGKTKELGNEGLQKIKSKTNVAKEKEKDKDKDKDKQEKKLKKVFGVPLDPHSKELPLVLARALEYFQVKGLRHEGLFRLSGSQNAIQALKERFDNGEYVDLLAIGDVHTVASLLKLWFRELPEPLLTYELYDCFLAAAAITPSEGARHAAKSALKALPSGHYLTVKHLMAFLDLVQRDAEVNKMTPSNLALVFAPNLLRPAPTHTEEDAILMLQDTPMANRLLEMFVQYYEELFEQTRHTPLAAPVSDPSKKIAFVWRSSQPPTQVSPLEGVDLHGLAVAGSASSPNLYSNPPPSPPPAASSPVRPTTASAPNLATPAVSAGIVQSVYFGAPPDLSGQAGAPAAAPSMRSPKSAPKPAPAAALPKRPSPSPATLLLTPATGPPPALPSRPVARSSSSGVSLVGSSSSTSSVSSSTTPSTQKKVPIVHRRSRSSDDPPVVPPRSSMLAKSYTGSARLPQPTEGAKPAAVGSVTPPNQRASVKQLKQSFEN